MRSPASMREMYAGEQPGKASWRWLRPARSRAAFNRCPTARGSSTCLDFCRGKRLMVVVNEAYRARLPRVDWEGHAEREEGRYEDGVSRLPDDPDERQRQLVRIAMAAGGAGLARLMQDRRGEAAGWFARSAERYRESFGDAPPGSWGRLIGAVKSRVLAGDWDGAADDASWALAQGPGEAPSPVGRYAAALAALVLGEDGEAARFAAALETEPAEAFPRAVAAALAALAAGDGERYGAAVRDVLASFEERDEYLEDVPVADTVLVLEALAERRGIAARLRSPLLPA
jgi:hypothetical protein